MRIPSDAYPTPEKRSMAPVSKRRHHDPVSDMDNITQGAMKRGGARQFNLTNVDDDSVPKRTRSKRGLTVEKHDNANEDGAKKVKLRKAAEVSLHEGKEGVDLGILTPPPLHTFPDAQPRPSPKQKKGPSSATSSSSSKSAELLAAQIAASQAPAPLRTGPRPGPRNALAHLAKGKSTAAAHPPSLPRPVDDAVSSTFKVPAPMAMFTATPSRPTASTPAAHLVTSNAPDIFPKSQRQDRSYLVPIPISETPMIQRNRQLREQGRRRSSLTKRGSRISSLISTTLVPVSDSVPSSDFYKHISAQLPPPARMKAVLMWSLERGSIDKKEGPSTGMASGTMKLDALAKEVARRVQKDVLQALVNHKISTTWYSREKQPEEIEASLMRKQPNPANETNRARLLKITEHLNRVNAENELWLRSMGKLNDAFEATEKEQQQSLRSKESTLTTHDFARLSDDLQKRASLEELHTSQHDTMDVPSTVMGVTRHLDRLRMAVTRQAGRLSVADQEAERIVTSILSRKDLAQPIPPAKDMRHVLRALSRVIPREDA